MKKIQTHNLSQYGKKRMFGSFGVVEFDENGLAEIDDNTANYIVKNHEKITYAGEKLPEHLQPTKKGGVPKDLTEYQFELDKARDLLNSKQAQIKKLKEELIFKEEDVQVWKNLSDSLRSELADLKKVIVKVDPGSLIETSEDAELKNSLSEKSKSELSEMAEKLNLPKAEWRYFAKSELIDYLIKAS